MTNLADVLAVVTAITEDIRWNRVVIPVTAKTST